MALGVWGSMRQAPTRHYSTRSRAAGRLSRTHEIAEIAEMAQIAQMAEVVQIAEIAQVPEDLTGV
jgi:hypothetical protein